MAMIGGDVTVGGSADGASVLMDGDTGVGKPVGSGISIVGRPVGSGIDSGFVGRVEAKLFDGMAGKLEGIVKPEFTGRARREEMTAVLVRATVVGIVSCRTDCDGIVRVVRDTGAAATEKVGTGRDVDVPEALRSGSPIGVTLGVAILDTEGRADVELGRGRPGTLTGRC